LTLVCALPLAWVDKTWTGLLGRAAGVVLRRRAVGATAAAGSVDV
jgi:hypothetical protein